MATNEERIRLVIDGLNQLDQLKTKLDNVTTSFNALEQKAKSVSAGTRQTRGVLRGIEEDVAAERPGALNTRANVQQRRGARGRFLPGPNVNARRLAEEQLDFFQEIRGRAQRGQRNLAGQEIAARLRATAEKRTAEIVKASLENAEREVDQQLRQFANESVAKRASTRVGRGLATVNRVKPDATGKLNTAERARADQLLARTEEIRAVAAPLRANVAAGKATGSQVNALQKYAAELESLGEGFREIDRVIALRAQGFEKARLLNERFDKLAQPTAARPLGTAVRSRQQIAGGLIEASNAGQFEKFKRLSTAADRYASRLERESGEANKSLAANEKLSRATVSLAAQREKAATAQADFDSKFRRTVEQTGGNAQRRLDRINSGQALEGLPGTNPRLSAFRNTDAFERRVASAATSRAKKIEAAEAQLADALRQAGGAASNLERALERAASGASLEGLGKGGRAGGAFRNTDAFERRIQQNAQRRRDAEISLSRQQVREEARNAAAEQRTAGERRRGRLNVIGSAAIGGGFPLLFGQGAGAGLGGVIGGGLGGALGGSGGFAGGIVGSLIGTQFDKVKQSAIGMAEALREPSQLLEAMAAAGITTSSALKNTVAALEGLGRGAEAQQLVFAELERLGGTDYVQNLLELEEANKALQEAWSQLSVTVQKELLPYFIELTNAATALTKPLALLAQGLSGILPVLDALLTAAVPFGSVPLVKNLGNIVSGPGGSKKEDNRIRTPEISDAQQRKALDEAIARQKEVLDLQRRGEDLDRANSEFARDQAEKIFELRKRAADYDREVIDFRRAQEDKLFAKQQENDRLRITAEKQIADNRVAALENAFRSASANDLTEGGPSAIVAAANEYIKIKATGEAEIRAREQETKLKILAAERESANYSYELKQKERDLKEKAEKFARDVSTFQYETTKKIVDLQRQSADYQYAKWEQIYKLQATLAGKDALGRSNPLGAIGGTAPYAPADLRGYSYGPQINAAAKKGNVDPRLLAGLVKTESAFNPSARSPAGAYGLAQLMPGTAKELGVNINDLNQNLEGGAKYLRQMIDKFGSVEAGLRAYNQGPGNQQRFPQGVSAEARNYPGKVLAAARGYGFAGSAGGIVARTGATGIGTGAHLDVRWGDGRPITKADADKYMILNGKPPSAYGVTSGYGPRRAPTAGASSFHRGIDFGTPEGTPVMLKGGATAGASYFDPNGGGQVLEINTPSGTMKLLHLGKGSTVSGITAPSVSLPSAASVAGPNPRAPVAQKLGSIPQPSAPSLAGYGQRNNALDAENRDIQAEINALLDERQRLDEAGALTGVTAATNQAWMAIIQPLKDANRELGNQIAYNNEYADLIASGVNPAMAEQLTIVSQLASEQERLLDLEIQKISNSQLIYEGILKEVDAESEKGKKIKETIDLLEQQKAVLEGRRPEIQQQAAIGRSLVEQKESPQQRYQNAVTEAQGNLNKLTDPANQVIAAANGIGDAFGQAFKDVATGSKTAQEALSDMFTNIGASFIEMAAQIAAQQLTLSILKLFGGAFGGGLGGGGGGAGGLVGGAFAGGGGVGGFVTGGLFNTPLSFAGGGYTGDGARSGGIDGQGGFPAILHPNETVVDHSRPSSAVLDTFQGTDQTASSDPITVETQVINNVEYATVGQVRAASARAAKQGEAAAMNRMVYSASTRKRLRI